MVKNILKLLILVLFPAMSFAQIPVIEVPQSGNKYAEIPEVVLQSLKTEVKIAGGISTTTQTMVFKNNSDRILEGRLTFPLPDGVSVSGYALDIGGKLRNAVPVPKEKAKEVFESIEKRNVDPGILEKVEGNNFRTRIYPINPHQTRTVQISYHSPLKKSGKDWAYFLPLDYKKTIPEFQLKISVNENFSTPKLVEKPDGSLDFNKNGSVWTAEISKKDYLPQSNLRVNISADANGISTVLQRASGNNYYFFSKVDLPQQTRNKVSPKEIAIIWDNSLSGMNRDHEKEFALLNEYFNRNKNLKVKLFWLNNSFSEAGNFSINNGNWEVLKQKIQNTTYDGGTDFSVLKNIPTEEILFFSDGISSFGDFYNPFKVPVHAISASPKSNFSQLKMLARSSGGEFINLNDGEISTAISKLSLQPLKFLGIKPNSKITEIYPALPVSVDENFSISGISEGAQNTVTLLFGYGNTPTLEKTINLNSQNQVSEDWEVSKFWAQNKIAELETLDGKDDEIKDLGQQFGIVTKNSSLMVLENLSDYVRYKIEPPQELKADFDRIAKENRQNLEENRKEILDDAIAMMATLKEWYAKDFTVKKKYPKPVKKNGNERIDVVQENIPEPRRAPVYENTAVADAVASPPPPPSASPQRNSATAMERKERPSNSSAKSSEIDEVVVVGYARRQRKEAMTSSAQAVSAESLANVPANNTAQALSGRTPGITVTYNETQRAISGKINTAEVKSDAEYMQFFEKKNTEDFYQIYLKNRSNYIATPRYYFDIANLLYKAGKKDLAIKVLSSVADLDLENEEVYKLLGYKLKEFGIFDKELFAFKKVLEWRPFDPQSYRDYALASEDNGQNQEALDNLYKILTKTYAPEMANRDDGIEETILMEINGLISRHKNLNTSKINPKLIADLPVNIRVVLNWNHDDTDLDLWVTDPNGEKCMYDHNSTEIGGRISNDFTDGFGPEQFLLKKAIKGKYKIETNFYNESRISVSGPTAIMAEIFINYATGKQERKIVVFQNQEEKDTSNKDGVLVGEFEF